jgi:hypothetical protein
VTITRFARPIFLSILSVNLAACAQAPVKPETPTTPAADYGSRNPNAPQELEQFGRLGGPWDCSIYNLGQGGLWHKRAGGARWTFNYALDGNAVTDIWVPDPDDEYPGSVGMNLRVYDPQAGLWRIAWTTVDQARFDLYEASYEDGDIIMWGQRPDHQARITFYNVRPNQFDWKYEFSPLDDGTLWTEIVRMQCLRPGMLPAVMDSGGEVSDQSPLE